PTSGSSSRRRCERACSRSEPTRLDRTASPPDDAQRWRGGCDMRPKMRTQAVATLACLLLFGGACSSKARTSNRATTSTAPSSTAPPTSSAVTPTTVPAAAPLLDVYPFANVSDARAWQRSYDSGGHQPWHLDPALTASSFIGFLGADRPIGQVLSVRRDATG